MSVNLHINILINARKFLNSKYERGVIDFLESVVTYSNENENYKRKLAKFLNKNLNNYLNLLKEVLKSNDPMNVHYVLELSNMFDFSKLNEKNLSKENISTLKQFFDIAFNSINYHKACEAIMDSNILENKYLLKNIFFDINIIKHILIKIPFIKIPIEIFEFVITNYTVSDLEKIFKTTHNMRIISEKIYNVNTNDDIFKGNVQFLIDICKYDSYYTVSELNVEILDEIISKNLFIHPYSAMTKTIFFNLSYRYYNPKLISILLKIYDNIISEKEITDLLKCCANLKISNRNLISSYVMIKKAIPNLTVKKFVSEIENNNNNILYYMVQGYFDNFYDDEKNNEEIQETEEKYINIIKKTRFKYLLDSDIINSMSLEMTEKFNLKIWLMLRGYSKEPFFCEGSTLALIQTFGLFENDAFVSNRLKKVLYMIPESIEKVKYSCKVNSLEHKELLRLLNDLNEENYTLNSSFDYELVPRGYTYMSDEIYNYLEKHYNQNDYQKLKRLDGSFGKKVNDFLSPYALINDKYVLKRNVCIPTNLKKLKSVLSIKEYNKLLKIDDYRIFLLPYIKLDTIICSFHGNIKREDKRKIFRLCGYGPNLENEEFYSEFFESLGYDYVIEDYEYNPKFCEFFFENFELLYINNFDMLSDIYENFDTILKIYKKNSGKNQISYEDIRIILNSCDDYSECFDRGNKKFGELANYAGVINNLDFAWYENLYNLSKDRRFSSIPRLNKTYEIDDIKLKLEVLRFDDPMNVLTGENEFMDNCYSKGDVGEDCLIHSCSSKNGRNLSVYLIDSTGEEILLTQSWLWRCGDALVLDNIESTEFYNTNYKKYAYVLKKALEKISEDFVNVTINDENPIKSILLGTGNDNSEIEMSSWADFYASIHPKDYKKSGYSDAEKIKIIYGNKNVDDSLETEAIYRDERKFICKKLDEEIDELYNSVNDDEWLNENEGDIENATGIYGEDFYLLYETDEYIEVSNIVRKTPRIEDESVNQILELMKSFNLMLKDSVDLNKSIKCELRGERIKEFYNLYLNNGYIVEICKNENEVVFMPGEKFLKRKILTKNLMK